MSANPLPPIDRMDWTPAEKKVARRAFDAALAREVDTIRSKVKKMIASDSTSVWQIHDYLTVQRKQIDRTYDYRYSMLIIVFANLMREGWLKRRDLDGLSEDKLLQIQSIAKR